MVSRSLLGRQGTLGRLVLVVLMVALFGQSGTATVLTRTTTVTALIQPTIEVALWPDESVELQADTLETVWKSAEQCFVVKANVPWGIVVTTDSPNGRLREYDLIQDLYPSDGLLTVYPLQLHVAETGSVLTLSSMATNLVSDSGPTGDVAKDIAFYYTFMPSYQDTPLPPERIYRIEVQFTVGSGY